MKRENFLIPVIILLFVSLGLTFNNNAMGALRQDADAASELSTIRENLGVYSKMNPNDARDYYEEALNELQRAAVSGFKSRHDDFLDTVSMLAEMKPWKPQHYKEVKNMYGIDVYDDEPEEEVLGIGSYIV